MVPPLEIEFPEGSEQWAEALKFELSQAQRLVENEGSTEADVQEAQRKLANIREVLEGVVFNIESGDPMAQEGRIQNLKTAADELENKIRQKLAEETGVTGSNTANEASDDSNPDNPTPDELEGGKHPVTLTRLLIDANGTNDLTPEDYAEITPEDVKNIEDALQYALEEFEIKIANQPTWADKQRFIREYVVPDRQQLTEVMNRIPDERIPVGAPRQDRLRTKLTDAIRAHIALEEKYGLTTEAPKSAQTIQDRELEIVQQAEQELVSLIHQFRQALDKTDDPDSPDYFNPETGEIEENGVKKKLDIKDLDTAIEKIETTIIEPWETGTVYQRTEAGRLQKVIKEATDLVTELHKRISDIKERQRQKLLEQADQTIDEVRILKVLLAEPQPRNKNGFWLALVKIDQALDAYTLKKNDLTQEMQEAIEPRVQVVRELRLQHALRFTNFILANIKDKGSAAYKDSKKTLTDFPDEKVAKTLRDYFDVMEADPLKQIRDETSAELKKKAEAEAKGEEYTPKVRQGLQYIRRLISKINELELPLLASVDVIAASLKSDSTRFPEAEDISRMADYFRTQLNRRKVELEGMLQDEVARRLRAVMDEITNITWDNITAPQGSGEKKQYSDILKYQEMLLALETSINPNQQPELYRQIGPLKNKLKEFVRHYLEKAPHLLSDEDLLMAVRKTKMDPYDYAGWRQTNKDINLLPLRNEWMRRTEYSENLTEEEDLKRANLKVRFFINFFMEKLIRGKQLPEIEEGRVYEVMKQALMTRVDLIKGLALYEGVRPGEGKAGKASVLDMMWFLVSQVARKPKRLGADPELVYEKLSDAQAGASQVMASRLAQRFPDSEGYTKENRELAVSAAILFKFLTPALTELQSQTQTGAHDYSGDGNPLFVEDVFKTTVHIVQRYPNPSHPWVEWFIFLKEIPEDWGANDDNMEIVRERVELIEAWLECFFELDGIKEMYQANDFLVPVFPNLLQLSSLRPDEAIRVGKKLIIGSNVHVGDVGTSFTVPKENKEAESEEDKYLRNKKGEIETREVRVEFKTTEDETDLDYDPDLETTLPRVYLHEIKTKEVEDAESGSSGQIEIGERVGRKQISRVMKNGVEVRGTFQQRFDENVPDEAGIFFIAEDGQEYRVVRDIVAKPEDFTLVTKSKRDEELKEDVEWTEWELNPGAASLTIERADRPKAFRTHQNDKKLDNPELWEGATIREDEEGTWVYDNNGREVGAVNNGLIYEVGVDNPRKLTTRARVIGKVNQVYYHLNGELLPTNESVYVAGTDRRLGGVGSEIQTTRTIKYYKDKRGAIRGEPKFRRNHIDVANGRIADPILGPEIKDKRTGQTVYAENLDRSRDRRQRRHHHIDEGKKPDEHYTRYETRAYVDKSSKVAVDENGEVLGVIKPSGNVERVEADGTVTVVGRVGQDKVIRDKDGKAVGFVTYEVRLVDPRDKYEEHVDSRGRHKRRRKKGAAIGVVFPEVTDDQGAPISNIPVEARVIGLDDERKISTLGNVNTWEKMLVARKAFEDLMAMVPGDVGHPKPDEIIKSRAGDRPLFHKVYADLLGKIKMQEGPHIHLMEPILKFMLIRWITNAPLHAKNIEDRQKHIREMHRLWYEIIEHIEQMFFDSGLSGAFKIELENILAWMIDEGNHYKFQEGMNESFTGTFWKTEQGRRNRIKYLDLFWKIENQPRPHPVLGRGYGEEAMNIGEAYLLGSVPGIIAGTAELQARIWRERNLIGGNLELADSMEEYLKAYTSFEDGLHNLPSPITRKTVEQVAAESKKAEK